MNKDTFTRLALAQQRTLYRIAISYTGHLPDAEDAMQEALLRAWNKRHTLRDETLFGTWLTRILINECKTILRRRKRNVPAGTLPFASVPAPDEDAALLRAELMALPEKYRLPLVLQALEGYSIREVAQLLHLPEGTVKSRIARARKKLGEEASDHAH